VQEHPGNDRENPITRALIRRAKRLLARPPAPIQFTGDPEADTLLNDLNAYPHAFVLACLMDRQVTAERAWLVPHLWRGRLGSFEFPFLAGLNETTILRAMKRPKPLHRFTETMASTFYSAVQRLTHEYDGDASLIWANRPSSARVIRRFFEFDGAGPKIASMAANILVRDFRVEVRDKFSIDISADVHGTRVMGRLGLAPPGASPELVIWRAREIHPTYPGIFDLVLWEVGRMWCRPQYTVCPSCYLRKLCPTSTTN
jgi:endonuclease III